MGFSDAYELNENMNYPNTKLTVSIIIMIRGVYSYLKHCMILILNFEGYRIIWAYSNYRTLANLATGSMKHWVPERLNQRLEWTILSVTLFNSSKLLI